MAYTDRYEVYMNEMISDIGKSRDSKERVVFGYTSDVDVLLTYDTDAFQVIYSLGDLFIEFFGK